jgi:ribosome maturation factor RimP
MRLLPEEIELRLRTEIDLRGLVLLDLKQRGERGSSILEVVVDGERQVTLDELADVARWMGQQLDEAADSLPGRYRLEVTSPGLDRPLEHIWQYRKNIGRHVKLTLDEGEAKRTTALYRLLDVVGTDLSVQPVVQGRGAKVTPVVTISIDRIVSAVIEPQM